MPYSITRHAENLVWVVLHGHLALHHAESYFSEMWDLLDGSPTPTDLLVDGRRILGAAPGARRRTEQIAHHPNLGHLAFVVSEFHMLVFAPLVKLVSGIGLFGDEHEAITYLRCARGLPPVGDLALTDLPLLNGEAAHDAVAPSERYAPIEHSPSAEHFTQRAIGARPAHTRPLPPLPASRLKQTPIYQRNPPHHVDSLRAGAGDGEPE